MGDKVCFAYKHGQGKTRPTQLRSDLLLRKTCQRLSVIFWEEKRNFWPQRKSFRMRDMSVCLNTLTGISCFDAIYMKFQRDTGFRNTFLLFELTLLFKKILHLSALRPPLEVLAHPTGILLAILEASTQHVL